MSRQQLNDSNVVPDRPFAPDSQAVMDAARAAAEHHQHDAIEPEHVLLALLACDAGPGRRALWGLDRRPEELCHLLEKRMGALDSCRRHASPRRFAPGLRHVIELAAMEASNRRQDAIDTGHLLLALTHPRQGGITSVLAARGVTYERVRAWLAQTPLEVDRIAERVVRLAKPRIVVEDVRVEAPQECT